MTKKITGILLFAIYSASVFCGGWYYSRKNMKKAPVRIVEKTVVKYNTIYRDVKKMDRKELEYELNQFYKMPPRLDGEIYGEWFVATAGLGDRNWSREFRLEVGSDNNWKYYVVGSLAVLGIGTYIYIKNR